MRDEVREIIAKAARVEAVLDDDEDLLMSGQLDSMSAMKAIAMLERTFSLTVPASDVTYDNFRSINAIATYLDGLRP